MFLWCDSRWIYMKQKPSLACAVLLTLFFKTIFLWLNASVSEITCILLKENCGLICIVLSHGLDKGLGNFNYSVHNNPHFLTPAEWPAKALVIYNSIIIYKPEEFFQALQLFHNNLQFYLNTWDMDTQKTKICLLKICVFESQKLYHNNKWL